LTNYFGKHRFLLFLKLWTSKPLSHKAFDHAPTP
jgi:hypothetical protein